MAIPVHVRRLREKVGRDLVVMPAAAAVVIDDGGRVLLHRRSDTGRWSLPGGILEPGEQPAEAVVREVAEETGIEVVVDRLAGAWTGDEITYPNGDRAQYVVTVHRCHPVGGELRVDGDESLEVAWFALDDLPALPGNQRERVAAAVGATTARPAHRETVQHAASSLLVPAEECSFCAYLAGRHPYTMLVRDDLAAVLVTREQRGVGHCLVIPVAHRETLLDLEPDEVVALARWTQRVARAVAGAYEPEGIAVWQNNGAASHQSVPHLHTHVTATLPGGGTDWGRVPRLSVAQTDAIAERLRAWL